MNEQITGGLFKRMILHGAAAITAQKQAINDLNVFPVPDGDTSSASPSPPLWTRLYPSQPPPFSGAPGEIPASFSPCSSGGSPRA
nr:hypothetical protein [uncultured Oscillibacter sp.]